MRAVTAAAQEGMRSLAAVVHKSRRLVPGMMWKAVGARRPSGAPAAARLEAGPTVAQIRAKVALANTAAEANAAVDAVFAGVVGRAHFGSPEAGQHATRAALVEGPAHRRRFLVCG